MQCPKCGNHLEIVIRETTTQPIEVQQPREEQLVTPVQSFQQPQPVSRSNKITDSDMLDAMRILSLSAQGKLKK